MARIGALNVHRGRLPEYAGAEPVKRALENGDETIVLTVHEMAPEIDAGEVLVERPHPANYRRDDNLDENVVRIKKEMLPLYPAALIEAIDRLIERHGGE